MNLFKCLATLFNKKKDSSQNSTTNNNCSIIDCGDTHSSNNSMSVSDIIRNELEAWDIPEDYLGYKAIFAMLNINKNYTEYNQIITALTSELGVNKGVVSSSFHRLVNRGKFCNSTVASLQVVTADWDYKGVVFSIYKWVVSLQ